MNFKKQIVYTKCIIIHVLLILLIEAVLLQKWIKSPHDNRNHLHFEVLL